MNSGSDRGADGELPSTSKRQSEDCEEQPSRRPRPGGASETDEDGMTALHHAALSGDTESVRALLEEGCNTRSRDQMGMTPLHTALFYQKEAAAELLVDADCVTDIRDTRKRTPLHWAALSGCVKVVRKLLAGGADANSKDENERTPLHLAIVSKREVAAEVLLGSITECDNSDLYGATPLHVASYSGLTQIAKALVLRGARLQAQDVLRRCPLYCALMYGHDGVAKVLLAEFAWRDIAIQWRKLGLPPERKEYGVRLLSECEAEMRRMRETRAEGSRLSLHDLARRHPSRLARRLSDEAIRRLSDRDLLTRDFPYFGDLLLLKLGEVRERKSLEDCFLRCFPLLFPPLPTTCTDVLLACLTDDDLRHVARAVEL